jgi:hypothetical protein
MRRYAGFSQVEVWTYCVMSNHFHILVEVSAPPDCGGDSWSDERLLEHLSTIYGERKMAPARSGRAGMGNWCPSSALNRVNSVARVVESTSWHPLYKAKRQGSVVVVRLSFNDRFRWMGFNVPSLRHHVNGFRTGI